MASELRIPEGIVVRTARGGADVLRGILNDLKQYSFTGYVKIILRKETMNSTGYLVMDQGTPTMSIYQFEKTHPREIRRIYAGDKSLRFIWEDSQDRLSQIELHSRVPKEEFDRRFPDARLAETEEFEAQIAAPRAERRPVKRPVPKREEKGPPEEEDPILSEIQKLRRQGYVVDVLEEMYARNRTAAKRELAAFQERTEELRKLERLLESLPKVGLDEQVAELKSRMNDPARLDEIREEIDLLREQIKNRIEQSKLAEKKIEEDLRRKKREEKVGDLYEMILQYQRGEIPAKETPICGKCGALLDPKGRCPKCAERPSEPGTAEPTVPEEFSFDTFVVGPNNKFAYAAAMAVAKAPDQAYNPLFIYGKTGLGKSHLLGAIARQLTEDGEEISMISAEKFAEELERSLEKESIPEFREKFRNRKALLIDDFQFLSGRELAQEEMLYLLEETVRNGGQIAVASDRLPKEIPRLNERLATKIQGGLIADIQPPEKETRMDILKSKAEEKGKSIPSAVIEYVAERVKTNVRELEAALNRLVAFATVMKLEIDLQLAKEVLLPAMTEPEERGELPFEVEIKPGRSYLVEEERAVQSINLFTKKIEQGFRGLQMTRIKPSQVREKFGASGEILWLTDRESKTEKTVPPSLEMIVHLIEEFIQREEPGVLLVDGLQYLISNTSFEGVLRFLRRLVDDISESSSIMMISVGPGTLKPQELSILERELETIKFG